ncbi:uncharacterized protein LOC126678227 [Mercurialis annua]|uniref:uncharacterized protein LOC126678227 n=1 Tax=Mercurialis annua TaxID=3986 RepID=UPI00215EBD09|nr:uncharacterized protein LOC126678227 [Mercurialis annua]
MNGPWMIQGDFNAVLTDNDRCGGSDIDNNHARELKDCMNDSNLGEMRSIGCSYSWSNNQIDNNKICRRLDRAFINENWQDGFQNSYFEALPNGISDYSPILVNMLEDNHLNKNNFKYLSLWSYNPEHNKIMEEEWKKEYQGYAFYKISQKLKCIKRRFIMMNKQHYSGISLRVKNYKDLIERARKDLQLDPMNNILLEEERVIYIHLRGLMICEESFYKQKSRVQWLNLGDSNTKFFHNSIKQRRSRNNIAMIKLDNGEIINNRDKIHEEMKKFYKNMFSKRDGNISHI